jgi:hypothetical protein
MTDKELEQKLQNLRALIIEWATKHDIWSDASFTDWITHFKMEPTQVPCVLVMTFEGPLYAVLNCLDSADLCDEFNKLFEGTDFFYELHDHVTAVFYPADEPLTLDYQQYFEWQWICKLVADDYGDLYEELFVYFRRNPERLRELHHRDFEKLLDSVFRNNGYQTILGPGQGDEGVDLRLYHKDAIGDVATLVQAKRYANHRPIKLEAVAALCAAVDDERSNRGLFVTTSRFLPSAKRFAARRQHRITLATLDDVARWCNTAATNIVRDKSQLVSPDHVSLLIATAASGKNADRIVYANWGYNCTLVDFAIVLKETRNAALLMELPSVEFSGDGQMGTVVPDLSTESIKNLTAKHIIRTTRSDSLVSGGVRYWGNHKLFHVWDGNPVYFNSAD